MLPLFQTFSFWIVLSLSIVIILLFLYLLSPLFYIICWAGILAFFVSPVYKYINQRLNRRKRLSAVIVFSGVIFFIILPLALIGIHLYSQVSALLETIQPLSQKNILQFLNKLQKHPKIYALFSKFSTQLQPFLPEIQREFTQFLSNLVQLGFTFLKTFIKRAFSFSLQLAFTLITFYYFLVDGEKILNTIKDLIPVEEKEKEKIFTRISSILQGVLYGNILTALIQGAFAFFIYFILGIPQNLIWAFLTVVASFIPVAGTGLVWIPLTIYLVVIGKYTKAVILFLFSILIISQVDNIVKPMLIGEKTKIHNLLIFFAVLGGLAKFGFLGLFLGPVILGLFLCVLEIYKLKWINSENTLKIYTFEDYKKQLAQKEDARTSRN
jgi:predicted PurR-regulated permease PerM